MGWWQRFKWRLRRKKPDPFELTEPVETRVSQVEYGVYCLEAKRNGMTIAEWVRSTLNQGIPADTLRRLSSPERLNALDAAYHMLDEEDRVMDGAEGTYPILPLAPKKVIQMNKKLSGHPCFHLSSDLPRNLTRAECQGTCQSPQPGYAGRPCFWGSPVAKSCDGFRPKIAMPTAYPTKATR